MSQTRRLAAILAADVAGYSRLMGADEEGTLGRLKALRRELVDPKIAEHHGRIVKTTGDGMLVEFASVVDAVRCAVEVQQAMPERNNSVAADNRIELRIGINLGDVIVEGDDLYVAGVIEPTLQAAEIRRTAEQPTNDLTAYDLYLRALPHLFTYTRSGIRQALSLLEQATDRDPRFWLALALVASTRVAIDIHGGANDPERNRSEAIGQASRCIESAAGEPEVLCGAGHVLAYFGEDIEAAIALVDRGLALNPSYARGWIVSGLLRLYAGDIGSAIEHLERSMRLNPRAPMGLPLTFLGIAYFFDRRFNLAAPKLLAAIQERPSYWTPYRFLAACYAHMGRLSEAREVTATLRRMSAVLEPRVAIWRKPEHQELLLLGLRLAAGEET